MKSSNIIIYKNLNELYQPLNRAQDFLQLYERINESPHQFITNKIMNQIVQDAQEKHLQLLPYQLSSILEKQENDSNFILLQQQEDQEQIDPQIQNCLEEYAKTHEQQNILYLNISNVSQQQKFNHINTELKYITFEPQNNYQQNIHQNITIIPVNSQNQLITQTQMKYLYKNIIAKKIMSFNQKIMYVHLSVDQQLISLEGIQCIVRYLTKSKPIQIIIYLHVGKQSEENLIKKYLITICNGLWGNKFSNKRELPSEKWFSEMITLLKKSNLIGESKIFQQIRANLNCLEQFHRKEQEIEKKIQGTIQLFNKEKKLISIKPIDQQNNYIEFIQFHIDYNEQIIVLQSKLDFRVFYYVCQFDNLEESQFKSIQIPQSLEDPSILVKDSDILICYGFNKNKFNDQIYLYQIEEEILLTLNRNLLLNVIKSSNCNFEIIHNRSKPGVCKNSILGGQNQFMLIGGNLMQKNENQTGGSTNIIEFIQYDKQSMVFHSEIIDKTSNYFKVAFLPSPQIIVLEGVLNKQNYAFVIDDPFNFSVNQPINRKQFVYMITQQKKQIIIIDKTPMSISEHPKIKSICYQYTQYLNPNNQENQLSWNLIGGAIIGDSEKYSNNRQQNLVIFNCTYNPLNNIFVINYMKN